MKFPNYFYVAGMTIGPKPDKTREEKKLQTNFTYKYRCKSYKKSNDVIIVGIIPEIKGLSEIKEE